MVARARDVEDREEGRGLSAGGQHARDAALQIRDLRRDGVVRGVLQAGVEITGRFQVEKLSHFFTGIVLIGRALVDGQDARLPVFGRITALYRFCVETEF